MDLVLPWPEAIFSLVALVVTVLGVVFWAAVIILVVRLIRSRDTTRSFGAPPRSNALNVLEERFARGEISREEFTERREVLRSSNPG
ncbi:MAG: SHOCT domain-containing protein [Actinomycetota bacterium]|nr:SHOCT domain-containing protein [Actinomycetota bacterium]